MTAASPNGTSTPPSHLSTSSRETAMSAAITGLAFAQASRSTSPSDSTRDGWATMSAAASRSRLSSSGNGGMFTKRSHASRVFGKIIVKGAQARPCHHQRRFRAGIPKLLHGLDQRDRTLLVSLHSQMENDRAREPVLSRECVRRRRRWRASCRSLSRRPRASQRATPSSVNFDFSVSVMQSTRWHCRSSLIW